MDFFIIFLMLFRVQIVVILGIIVLSIAYKKGNITDNNVAVFIISFITLFIIITIFRFVPPSVTLIALFSIVLGAVFFYITRMQGDMIKKKVAIFIGSFTTLLITVTFTTFIRFDDPNIDSLIMLMTYLVLTLFLLSSWQLISSNLSDNKFMKFTSELLILTFSVVSVFSSLIIFRDTIGYINNNDYIPLFMAQHYIYMEIIRCGSLLGISWLSAKSLLTQNT